MYGTKSHAASCDRQRSYAEVAPGPRPLFGICRHSGTATLTVALNDAGPASGEPVRAFRRIAPRLRVQGSR